MRVASTTPARAVEPELATGGLRDDAPRYSPIRDLGEGGMGLVRLEGDRRIGRDVAVKVLRGHLVEDAAATARFLREARIQGQLEHPAIVPVYDIGRTDDGEIYFTMKRVKGRTLRDVLSALRAGDEETRERYSRGRLLSAFTQVCMAVEFAHRRGVVHRDLKPENVMLGALGEVYVLDWGIARVRGQTDEDVEDLRHVELTIGATQVGAIVGTPGYMSPEQTRGDLAAIDGRSDVWALGAILYELLALEPLVPRGAPAAMIAAALGGVDADPSRLVDVPPEIAALCVHATAIEPDERLGSAGQLAEAIERYLDGDRDARARRAKAEEHAAVAERAAERALAHDSLDERRQAAAEAGRALALDPAHLGARRTLLKLMTTPPASMPPEAKASYDASRTKVLRSFYRESLLMVALYMPIVFYLFFFLDLREPASAAGLGSIVLPFGAICVWGWRRGGAGDRPLLALHVLMSIGLVFLARLTTPLIGVPLLTALNTLVTSAYSTGRRRWLYGVVGALPVLVAGFLELGGLWAPPTMRWTGEALVLRPMIGGLEGMPVVTVLLLLSALPVMASVVVSGRVRDESDRIERTAHVQRWQLEQLVPPEG